MRFTTYEALTISYNTDLKGVKLSSGRLRLQARSSCRPSLDRFGPNLPRVPNCCRNFETLDQSTSTLSRPMQTHWPRRRHFLYEKGVAWTSCWALAFAFPFDPPAFSFPLLSRFDLFSFTSIQCHKFSVLSL